MDRGLRDELLEMATADETAFNELTLASEESEELRAAVTARSDPASSSPAWPVEWQDDPPDVIRRLQTVVRRNTQRFREIVEQRGWPGRGLVGDEGAGASWLLVHHADDLDVQRRCLPLLETAVIEGDAPTSHLEWLTDRILLREGRPEKYGTHAGNRGNPPVPILPPRSA